MADSMIDWSTCLSVEHDPQRVSGAWVFKGTRVPVAALFENIEDGAKIDEFVEWFPGVTGKPVYSYYCASAERRSCRTGI